MNLLDRMKNDVVLVAEGYVFELERRGFLKAGPFVPEVVLENPSAVRQLHEEFLRAGSDVVVACTYYGHRAKLKAIGREDRLEALNLTALKLAREAAAPPAVMARTSLPDVTDEGPRCILMLSPPSSHTRR